MKKTLTILTSLFAFNLYAAEIVPASGVSILYINGQEAESKLGANQIDEGYTQVVLRMDKEVGRGSGNGVFTSKPYVIELDVTGDKVKIAPPRARSVQEAEIAFRGDSPKWKIVQDGKALPYKQEALKGKKGVLPYFGMDELVAKHNQQRGIFFENGRVTDKPVEAQAIAVATTTAAVASTSSKVEKTSAAKPVVSSNVDQLKAWYLKSSKEERKAFRRWMIDQE